MRFSRRDFLFANASAGAAWSLLPFISASHTQEVSETYPIQNELPDPFTRVDLAPAEWIWPKVGRTLPNTVILFRKEFRVNELPENCTTHIFAESRYRLYVNGVFVQFGPAPCDPRYPEIDKLDLAPFLKSGVNCIAVEVLYYGHGDGTWPTGVPGFIFRMDFENQTLVSNEKWVCDISYAWKPGKYKRWFLRAFQEDFDAQKYPYGWKLAGFDDSAWGNPHKISQSRPDEPLIKSSSKDYLTNSGGSKEPLFLIERTIPPLQHKNIKVEKLEEAFELDWKVLPEEFFDFDLNEEDSFTWADALANINMKGEQWGAPVFKGGSIALTFSFEEQLVGFPFFSIYAPKGTIVELLVHEAHLVKGTHRMLNTHFNSWSRFTCKEGWNHFEAFDYESVKWLQVHIRNTESEVLLKDIGVRRRIHPFAKQPNLLTSNDRLNKVLDACTNTVLNQSQDLIVDGMGRERQQYSNDVGHVIHALNYGFAATPLMARFCNTFSQGITKAGYFLDCWPAFDRFTRIYQREIGITPWGPLLDHGIGFNFDCYYYYQYTGNLSQLKYVYPRLKRFFGFMANLIAEDGLVPVENLGIPVVWVDHMGYEEQKHKHCAFNLYFACMLEHALQPLAKVFEDHGFSKTVSETAGCLLKNVKRTYWSLTDEAFVSNLPWSNEEGKKRFDERSLSLAIIYDLVPPAQQAKMRDILEKRPESFGRSFPTNAVWRFWALGKLGAQDTIINEFSKEWYEMPSVLENNTLGEFFDLKHDDTSQWSHASIAPLICIYTSILGIKPLIPGFAKTQFKPRLGNLNSIKGSVQTPLGEITFDLKNTKNKLEGTIALPPNMEGLFIGTSGRQDSFQGIHTLG